MLLPALEEQLRVGQQLVKVEGDVVSLVCDQCVEVEGMGERREKVRARVSWKQGELLLHYWEGAEEASSEPVKISLPGERVYVERVSVHIAWFRSEQVKKKYMYIYIGSGISLP